MIKKTFVALASALVLILALVTRDEAQQPKKVPRIGFLAAASASSQASRLEAFLQGLHELGYTEGKNIAVEYRFAEGDFERLPDLASELVRLNVDIIIPQSTPASLAAKQATTTIPIVFVAVGDAVAMGLVGSLARPGGNITGISSMTGPGLFGKHMEILKETVPKLTRVAFLSNPTNWRSPFALREIETVARALKISLQPLEARRPDEYNTAFAEAIKGRADAILVVSDPMFLSDRTRLADLATKSRLPAIYGVLEHVEAGGLMAYAADRVDMFRRAAAYVDKILKGSKPADLPVEQPTKFEFIVNLKAAKQIGLTIPQSVLFRADKVIK